VSAEAAQQTCEVSQARGDRHCSFALVVIGVLVLVTPLGYASPADAGWIAGVWDAADHDDEIALIDMMDLLLHTGTGMRTASESIVNRPPRPVGMLSVLSGLVPDGVAPGVSTVRGPPPACMQPTSVFPPFLSSPAVHIAVHRFRSDSHKPQEAEPAPTVGPSGAAAAPSGSAISSHLGAVCT